MTLSATHRMLAHIERQQDAHFVNRIANDSSVDRHIRGYIQGRIDLTELMAKPGTIVLAGEHGAMVFHPHQPGFYECHTAVLPPGRGRWTLDFVRACLFWIFSRTDAIEIVTKVPKGNLPARALVKAIGGVYEFTNPQGWVMDLDPVPADIYSMHVQSWIRDAEGLRERGGWFHAKLESEYARFGKTEKPHPDDPTHDRFVGAACEMILGGQPQKGVIFYNRWAVMAGYEPIQIVGFTPLTIDIRDAMLVVRADDFWMVSCNI